MKRWTLGIAALIMPLFGCTTAHLAQNLSTSEYVYKIGSSDKLTITVYGEEKLSGDYIVGNDGKISFPLVGDVQATGKTIEEFRAELTHNLGSAYLRNPKITAQVTNIRPIYILGEVNKPGAYAYSPGLSVYAVVAQAGGYTYRASTSEAYIRHENSNIEQRVAVGSSTAAQPGDTIRVPQKYF